MKLESFSIKNYRSIQEINIKMPEKKPLILFGPNNAGKTNILSALERMMGERYPTYIEVKDSDYFMRDSERYPTIELSANFDESYHYNNRGKGFNKINLIYGYQGQKNDNRFSSDNDNKLYITNENREQFQSFLLDAERNASYHFNYSNRYSLLSKLNKSLHNSLTDHERERLSISFENVKEVFQNKPEFSGLFKVFKESIDESIKGFVHHLDADFSAYDPNNYAKSLRINAYERDNVRSFDEFGTGEQQILIMAFAKAYMQTFKGETFLFILEEPEANLHPLAQKWLKEYIYDLCEAGLQIVISTHAPHFISPINLEGLVRVYKDSGVTKIKQLTKAELYGVLINTGVPSDKISLESVGEYFDLRLYAEQLEGMFAETVILVEGLTEKLSIPIWLEKQGFYLPAKGVEIINCMGKANIPTLYRLYLAYGYSCICIFDGDYTKKPNERKNILLEGILADFKEDSLTVSNSEKNFSYICGEHFICFENDYESTLKFLLGEENYDLLVSQAKNQLIENKQGIAKFIARESDKTPEFVFNLIQIINDNILKKENAEA